MSSVRAYISVKGLEVKSNTHGAHFVTVVTDGASAPVYLTPDKGRFYIDLNGISPFVPAGWESRITEVTSIDTMRRSCLGLLVREGVYTRTERGGKKGGDKTTRAEVTDMIQSGGPCLIIQIAAPSISTWRKFREDLLSGKILVKHAYTRAA